MLSPIKHIPMEKMRMCPTCQIGALPDQPIQHFVDCPEHNPAFCEACKEGWDFSKAGHTVQRESQMALHDLLGP